MFKLLSKESNIFSIPVYLGFFLMVIILSFNIFDFNILNIFSAAITFVGISLGYFLFNKINLTKQTHLPLFLYTFIVFALYPDYLDIGIAVSLLTNSFLLFIFTNENSSIKKNRNSLVVGSILAIDYIFLPTTYPIIFFVLLHIVSTSDRILINIFRLFFGIFLIFSSYFSFAYFLHWNSWDDNYLPVIHLEPMKDFYPLYFLIPVVLFLIYAVLDHFAHFNEKSPVNRFKYSFLLVFSLAQLITISLYMGKSYDYLILMAFPTSIILSRMLRFFPQYWMKELCLWMIICSLIVFKIANCTN